jgi:Helix-turn-helix domain
MTLQAGDKLMSLTDVSEMLGIPVHTLYRWRYKGDGPAATELAVTCGTVGRPSRLGWNSTSTNASKRAQANRSPSGRQGIEPRAKPIGPGEISGLLAARVACLAAHVDLSGRVSDEPHSKASRSQIPRALARP